MEHPSGGRLRAGACVEITHAGDAVDERFTASFVLGGPGQGATCAVGLQT